MASPFLATSQLKTMPKYFYLLINYINSTNGLRMPFYSSYRSDSSVHICDDLNLWLSYLTSRTIWFLCLLSEFNTLSP